MLAVNEQPAGLKIPDAYGLSPDQEEELRDELWQGILLGSSVDDMVDVVAEDRDWLSETDLVEIVDVLVSARIAQLEGRGPSAVHRAFDELAEVGILARDNFTCCGTCLAAEIGDELTDDQPWYAYLAFHHQDAEGLIQTGETYLSYGLFAAEYLTRAEWDAMEPAARDAWYDETLATLLREKAFPILEKHGMSVEWDGTIATRILVKDAEYYVGWEPSEPFSVTVDEQARVETVLLDVGDDASGPLAVARTTDPTADDQRVRVSLGDITVHDAIYAWTMLDGDVVLVLSDDAAATLQIPDVHRLGGMDANIAAGYQRVRAMLEASGEYIDWLGRGFQARAANQDGLEVVVIDDVEGRPLSFARMTDQDDPDFEPNVVVIRGEDGEPLAEGVTSLDLLDDHTIAVHLDAESQEEFGLPEETRIVFREADAPDVHARIWALYVAAGEVDEQGNLIIT